jgi:hypothetical protein
MNNLELKENHIHLKVIQFKILTILCGININIMQY